MLLIRTSHDIQTHYLFTWSEILIRDAEHNKVKVLKVEGTDVNIETVKKRINSSKPRFVCFNGHGNKHCFYDNDKKEFLGLDAAYLLKNTVTFARACDALNELCPQAIKDGCDAFIGYKKKFWIARTHEMESRPLKDPVAAPLLENSNLVVKSLLKGRTVGDAVNVAHEHAANLILKLIYSKEPLASATLAALVTNDEGLGFEGNPNAKIIS